MRIRALMLASVLAQGSTCALAQATMPAPEVGNPRAEYIRSHYSKFEYRIPMRDGTRLFTAVYVPSDAGRKRLYPLLLTRTPYSASPYGANRYRERLGPTAAYEKEGFIFVVQDVRGRHMSEGEFVNMRPQRSSTSDPSAIDESTDSYDTIDWLLRKLPYDNGKVGLWGVSYPGFYSSAGAINSHPALKAVSPQAPIADWFRGDDMHRHGAFNLQLSFAFFAGFGQERPKPSADEKPTRYEFGTPDAYQWFLDLGPVINAKKKFEKPVPFFDEILAHPNYDAFWQARNILPHLRNIKAAVLTVGGWYDTEDLYGPLQTYASIEKQNPGIRNSLVIGPWPHGGWTRDAISALGDTDFGFDTSASYQPRELAFFQHHLKDAEDPQLPEAWVFETGANRWREFDQWPPAQARVQSLYFGAQGSLSFQAPTAADGAHDSYPSDPAKPVPYTQEISQRVGKNYMGEDQRFVASRPDVLVYRSAPLEQDLTVAGPLEARLFFSTSGSDADLVVKLIDEWPGELPGWTPEREKAGERNRGGQQTLVRGEPMRLRYRNSYSTPAALQPDQVTPVNFAINDVMHTFKRGHRIMIQIQSSWFPFIDRNPQTFVPSIYAAKPEDFQRAEHHIWRDAQYPSALRIAVLPAIDE
jgi:hypothetical protein